MIISGKSIQSAIKVYGEQNQVGKNSKTEKKQVTQGRDEVILSKPVQEFAPMFKKILSMSEVRPTKVNDLSQQINAGTYHIDAKAIADKMMGRVDS